jgi:ornithine cyclodeaminase/alanine dehydrogenase-like protein (mu-crystallin family)
VELAAAVEAGVVARADVTEIGAELVGEADGRRSADDITLFDSTGPAIQDLAMAKAAFAKGVRARPGDARTLTSALDLSIRARTNIALSRSRVHSYFC